MKRFKSLLSLIVAVVAVFMVGFTTVKADQIKLVSGKVFFENITNKDGKKRDFHLKKVSGNDSAYAFCLDSQHVFFEGNYTSNSGLNYNSDAIKNVILNAYSAGLGTGSNKYGISNDELYMITQMAVWDAAHGTYQYDVNNKYGHDGMAIGDTYDAWLSEAGKEYRRRIYNELRKTTASVPNYSISVGAQGKKDVVLTAAGDKSDFGSEQFKIDGPSNLTYTVSIDKNSSSKGACVWYGGECKESQQIPAGKNFRLKADYVANQDVKVVANVKSSEYLTGYSFNLYQPNANGNNYQNAAVFIPEHNKYEAKISATGRDDVKREQPTTLKVSKTDVTGQVEIPGAHMRITDVNGKEIIKWESGKTVKEISSDIIIVGQMYKLYEDVAPAGYVPVHNAFGFVLNANGTVTTCDLKKNEKECVKMSEEDILKIVNEPTKLTVSKTDGTGQAELDGAKMFVYELGNKVPVDSWISDSKVQHQIEGLVIGKIYRMEETSSPVGFDPLTVNIYFKLDDNGKVQLCNVKNDDEKTAECGGTVFKDENGVTYAEIKGEVLVIINYPSKTTETSLTISKKDFTTGKEIVGAHLQIFRVVDGKREAKPAYEWDSTEEDYIIKDIKPGKYVLVETIPVTGYDPEMIILGNPTTEYEFEIVEGQQTKIDVYNALEAKKETIPDVPNTGITTSAYLIGTLVMLAGAGTIVIAKKKENM